MMALDPLILYSTNTWLAWAIAKQYYGGLHWVWCSPFFRQNGAVGPPSAIPGAIYDRLFEDVTRGDRHSVWISKNRVGLAKGAQCKRAAGVISAKQHGEILEIIREAQILDFRPLLFVMPATRVRDLLVEVPPAQRAHPLSVEFIIEALPTEAFDLVDARLLLTT
jgi:hypothetical protein